VTIGMGVTFSAFGHNQPVTEILYQTDMALYEAKKAGRNRVEFKYHHTITAGR
jgi:PleD family two-component response regulator